MTIHISRPHHAYSRPGAFSNAGQKPTLKVFQRLLVWIGILVAGFSASTISVGPIPVYYLDILAGLLFLLILNKRISKPLSPVKSRVVGALKILWFSMVISELYGITIHGGVFESIYMTLRYTVAVGLTLTIPSIINSRNDVEQLLKGLLIGGAITAVITVGSSLPQSRPYVSKYVLQNPVVGARNTTHVRMGEFRGADKAVRGNSLLGNTNITGGFLILIWPVAMFCTSFFQTRTAKRIAIAASILIPFGALASYSRATYFALCLVLVVTAFYGKGSSRTLSILAALLVCGVVFILGQDSESLYIDRVIRSTERILENRQGADASERFLSYGDTIRHLSTHPRWLMIGGGGAGKKMQARGERVRIDFDRSQYANHSAFAMAYFYFGMPAAICHLVIISGGFFLIFNQLIRHRQHQLRIVWQGLLASWFGTLPWWLFSPTPGATARGLILFLVFTSLVLSFKKISPLLVMESNVR